ncbi:unnamed protein product, partial [Ectocarpus fasciculatus]
QQGDQHYRDNDVHVLPVHQPGPVREGQADVRVVGHHEDPHHGGPPQDHGPHHLPEGRGRARYQLGETKAFQLAVQRSLAKRAGVVPVVQVLLQLTQRHGGQRIHVAKVKQRARPTT